MRRPESNTEIATLIAPLLGIVDAAWQRMHWWIGAMAVAYALSGITIVKADETAVVLRWGRLVGETPALQEHGPGLLFALPRPIDQVVRVQTKHVSELQILDLETATVVNEQTSGDEDENAQPSTPTLDPIRDGYALTGDQNIVHLQMIARYRIRDPGQWAFYGPKVWDILRVEITSAMVQSLGEMGVDRVLSDGRKDLIATATRRAQAGLDAAHSGLELSSLELTRLAPPTALASDFSAVQSAFIGAETRRKEAEAFAATAAPNASTQVDADLQAARAAVGNDMALAVGEAQAFAALDKEYRANPAVVSERLYRNAVEKALSVSSVRWLPPPVGGSYKGMRITIGAGGAAVGTKAPEGGPDDRR